MDVLIRAAAETDYTLLPDVEVDAAQAFRGCGLDEIADGVPATVASYLALPKDSAIFVADCRDATAIGFVVAMRVDGEAYLKEIAVRRAYAGRGIGRRLIDAAVTWSRNSGYRHMTLTTFADVPFNAPFYRKNGFSFFDPDQDWPELRAIRENEPMIGLDVRPRVAMIRGLQSQGCPSRLLTYLYANHICDG